MKIKHTHLLIIAIVVAAALTLIIRFSPDSILRIILGIPFTLLLPGYVLTMTLFPANRRLNGPERLFLSLGVSLVLIPIIGLVINYIWGITLNSFLYALAIFILFFALVAIIRVTKQADDANYAFIVSLEWFFKQNLAGRILSILLVIVACGTIVTAAYTIITPKTDSEYTELYLLDSQGSTDNYPYNLKIGDLAEVTVVIVNHEKGAFKYALEVKTDSSPGDDIPASRIELIDEISLEKEGKYQTVIRFTLPTEGEGQKVYFILFKEGDNNPYLEVNLTINIY
ncbi:MAG: DUF1616 domain-containing protein [Dehalococcoidales bacterium]